MDIEESSESYRGFRSSSYPALTRRIVDSGSVLLRASSWFALVVTAASAGYNMTQRLVSESAAPPQLAANAAPQLRVASANIAQAAKPAVVEAVEPQPTPAEEPRSADATAQRASAPAVLSRTVMSGAVVPHKTGAVVRPQQALLTAAAPDVEASASEDTNRHHTALIAERVREHELDSAATETNDDLFLTVKAPAAHTVKGPAAASGAVSAASEPLAFTRSAPAPVHAAAQLPSVVHLRAAPRVEPTPQLPLAATARIGSLSVNGSVSSANVRHGIERVQPSLAECYTEAARRAGQNRFSQVRVVVSIDEAGRVKTQPTVEGAELPGLQACLSSAFSKLVCRAPDTGTAKASIMLQFAPLALAATQLR